MTIISLEDIGMSYGPRQLFEGVTFGLDDGDKVGLIGLNGSGKSTLLRIIAGREQPERGRATIANERVVAYLPQNPPFDPDQTVLDAVFPASDEAMRLLRDYEMACHDLSLRPGDERILGRVAMLAHQLEASGGWDLETNAQTVLSQLGISDTRARMGLLSGGERKRVALAHALVSRPHLLVLDEPTNHLDADTIAWFETYLARYVSVFRFEGNGRIKEHPGNYSAFLEAREREAPETFEASVPRPASLLAIFGSLGDLCVSWRLCAT